MTIKTKVPPPIVALAIGFLINYTKDEFPKIHIGMEKILGSVLIISGLIVIASAIILFKKNKTTVTPLDPSRSTKLITRGIYKYSRNPMYLGLLLIIISTTIFYLNIFSITTPIIFYFWINKFQIKREEIFLTEKFGKEYLLYKTKTRRWI